MAFPSTVNITQAPALPGDFASTNPRSAAPGNVGAWIAGTGGVNVGTFGWGDLTSTDTTVLNTGTGAPTGFIAREFGDALIGTYLAETGVNIPAGFPVPLFNGGDFWVKNSGSQAATLGYKAFATLADGTVVFAAAGATVADHVETAFYAVGWGGGTGAQNELVKISSTKLD